jgi:undecaprenyl diphosphate synthase
MKHKSLISPKRLPVHVAIIMDGNGRWAKKKSLPRVEGHRKGAENVEIVVDAAMRLGIKVISLYAFSTENWARPKSEIKSLWKLLDYFFEKKIGKIKEKGIQIRHSGMLDNLPSSSRERILRAVEETKNNDRIILNFCLNYGGRQEIVDAVNRWIAVTQCPERISAGELEGFLYTSGLPDVDLLIRTSGEYRISNFLLWQIAYSEMVFLKVLWPDFRPAHLHRAILEYQKRERRFGNL